MANASLGVLEGGVMIFLVLDTVLFYSGLLANKRFHSFASVNKENFYRSSYRGDPA